MDTIQKKITINVPKRDKRIYCIHKKGMFAINIDIKEPKSRVLGGKIPRYRICRPRCIQWDAPLLSFIPVPAHLDFF